MILFSQKPLHRPLRIGPIVSSRVRESEITVFLKESLEGFHFRVTGVGFEGID